MTDSKKETLFKFQRIAAVLVFLTGMIIHVISLIIGREKFLLYIFTPLFDSIFGIPMAFAGITGIILWRNVLLDKTWKKICYWIGIFYLTTSIPFHVQTLITQDTGYINKFPEAYSYFVIPIMLFFSFFFLTQVRFKKNDVRINN